MAKATAYNALDPAHWLVNDYHNWHGKVGSVVGQLYSNAFSGDTTKYRVISGVQTATGRSASGSNAQLTASSYVNQTIAPQTGYTKAPAHEYVTHICCAQYFTPGYYATNNELVLAFAHANGDATAAATYLDSSSTVGGKYTLPTIAGYYLDWARWAAGLGVKGMCGYEGGYSPDYSNSAVTSAIVGATRAAQCVLTLPTTRISGSENPIPPLLRLWQAWY